MASVKTWCLLPLAALLLLSVVPTVAKVVKSMLNCTGFLHNETPPRVPGILENGNIQDQNRYKPICQTLNNVRRFVTLYDTKNRIPVFSAYKYKGENGCRPTTKWMTEPQLENEASDVNNMRPSRTHWIYNKQAGVADYINNSRGLDRGHLFPSSYALNMNDKKSTFTLTNVVPQEGKFNKGSWSRMEQCIRCLLDKYCNNSNGVIEGFLVTGAQPSTSNTLKDRVNIPSMLWSAFCCYSNNESQWLASAHWGNNVPDGDRYLQTKTLAELNNELTTDNGVFEVFPGTECPLITTVTHLYPNLPKNCSCPPPMLLTHMYGNN